MNPELVFVAITIAFVAGIGVGFLFERHLDRQHAGAALTITFGDKSMRYEGTIEQIIELKTSAPCRDPNFNSISGSES